MNGAIKAGLLVGGALLAYNAFAKGTALKTLNFYPKSVNDIQFDGPTPVIKFGLAIQNTSGQKMVLRSLAGNLYANGNLIGNISSYQILNINANSETVLRLNVRLSLLGIVEDIIQAIRGGGAQVALKFEAMANVDHYQVPIDISYKIP